MNNEYILFTSAGDNTSFYNLWCDENRNYDIFVCYYGSDIENKYEEYSDVYLKKKGSKMQNFYYVWENNIGNIINYKYYYIVRPENINIKPITFEQIKKLKKQCTFNILVTHYDKTITWLDNNDIDEININDINIDDIELDVKYYMLSDSSYTQSCSVSGGKRTRKIVKKNNKKSRSKRFFQKNKF